MKNQNGASALTGSVCLKKAIELFYVTHPRAPKALLGPFLTQANAECGRVIMRSTDAQVTACLVNSIDELAQWHSINNGQIVRDFAGADRKGVAHE